ncbi:hypothetical protein Hte_011409 [Hypoxylon texense]
MAANSGPNTDTNVTSTDPPPWHAAYPVPRCANPPSIDREEVLAMMAQSGNVAGRDYLLVDLRRADHKGGSIRGSLNLPAQSLYVAIPTLYQLVKAAGVHKVIWYCSQSRGRGPRAAGWFHDYLTDQGDNEVQSLVLLQGITGWAAAGNHYTDWMDDYDPSAWKES